MALNPKILALKSAYMGFHVSYSPNSLKGGYIGDFIGDYYRAA